MWQETIRIEGPYHFVRALERLAFDPIKSIDLTNGSIKVPLMIGNTPRVVAVQSVGTVEEPEFIVSSEAAPNEKEQVLAKLYRIFHWHESLHRVNEHFSATALSPLFDMFRGTPLVLDFDIYYCLIKTIIHQQLNMLFAHKLTERFVKAFGFQVDGVWFPPTPEAVSQLDYHHLRELQFSQRKAEYVIDTSKHIVAGTLDLHALESMSDEDVVRTLVGIRGIGHWTAQCFLLFGLGRKSIFPYGDIGIQNGLKKFYGLDAKPAMEQMQQWRREYAPYETYAALYLWEHVGNQTVRNRS